MTTSNEKPQGARNNDQKVAHTPGPWKPFGMWGISSEEVVICKIIDDCSRTPDTCIREHAAMRADRALICAAPDMLDALKYAVHALEFFYGATDAARTLRDTIQKAEGQTAPYSPDDSARMREEETPEANEPAPALGPSEADAEPDHTTVPIDLRDYFAAAALTGALADPTVKNFGEHMAGSMYHVADAMLKARDK